MGVKGGFRALLKPLTRSTSLLEMKGQRLGIDVACFLHAIASIFARDLVEKGESNGLVTLAVQHVAKFIMAGAKVICVMDSPSNPPPIKLVNGDRASVRAKALEKLFAMQQEKAGEDDAGDEQIDTDVRFPPPQTCLVMDASRTLHLSFSIERASLVLFLTGNSLISQNPMYAKMYNCAIKIDEKVIMAFVNKARDMGISVIVSAAEADAQLVHLFRARLIDFVVSEDMDFVVQGCDLVFNAKGWSVVPCTLVLGLRGVAIRTVRKAGCHH